MKNFVQEGKTLSWLNAGSDVASGAVVPLASGVGVACGAIAGGATGELMVEGVLTLAKETGTAWSLGDKLYWDAGNSRFTKTALGNKPAGSAAADALSAATTGAVKLSPEVAGVAAVVAAEATANGSDAATTQALANALKTKVNAILTALKDAGLMANA